MTPEAVLAYHARSFAPAARLLSGEDRARIAQLYALCRTVDNLADVTTGLEAHNRLMVLSADLCNADGADPLASEARGLFAGRPAGLASFGQLVDTIATDTGATCLANDAELDVYCMGVAGTVGMMVCALFDIPARWHPAASDLGKAMQLTNICRDVVADAYMGRRYLPYSLCPHTPQDIAAGRGAMQKDVRFAVARLLSRADVLYASGRVGLPALPLRLRLAVAAATAMYSGIGTELRVRSCDPMQGRVFVPAWRKAWLAAGGILAVTPRRAPWGVRQQHVPS